MFCGKCRTKLNNNDVFCPKCGSQVLENTSAFTQNNNKKYNKRAAKRLRRQHL